MLQDLQAMNSPSLWESWFVHNRLVSWMQRRAWWILITLSITLLVNVNLQCPYSLHFSPYLFLLLHNTLFIFFLRRTYSSLFFQRLFHLRWVTDWWTFPIKCSIFIYFFYCTPETLCWHTVHEYVPCSCVYSSKCWRLHCHICHSETVQLNRL